MQGACLARLYACGICARAWRRAGLRLYSIGQRNRGACQKKETPPKRGLCFVAVGRRRLRLMRACLIVVLALMSGCSPDEPNVVEVREPTPSGASTLEQRLDTADAARTVEVPCEELARLEAFLVEARQRYTEQHPDIVRMRQAIARLRDTVPTDEVCANAEPSGQRLRAVEDFPRQ
jgi:hypothetical protein